LECNKGVFLNPVDHSNGDGFNYYGAGNGIQDEPSSWKASQMSNAFKAQLVNPITSYYQADICV
jgi:hypothetical protein